MRGCVKEVRALLLVVFKKKKRKRGTFKKWRHLGSDVYLSRSSLDAAEEACNEARSGDSCAW